MSEVRTHEYEDTTMNKGRRVKRYKRTRDKDSKIKVILKSTRRKKDMSARVCCKFKHKSKLVSEVRRHENDDTTTNKGVRVKRYTRIREHTRTNTIIRAQEYNGERTQGFENNSTNSKVQVKHKKK